MKVKYSPRIARWIAEREGVSPDPDGSLTLEHPLADADWGLRHVLQYGPDAEVLEPLDLRAEIVRRLGGMAVIGT
jgi:predicted DNA-binding transcriptional regulator YafY